MDRYSGVNEILVKLFNDVMNVEEKVLITGEFSNISNNDMHIIDAIGMNTKKSMSTVAKELKVTVGTLTIAINALVKKGYVERMRSEEDRRVVLISLTVLGDAAYMHHKKFHDDMIETITKDLTEEEIKILINSLMKLDKSFGDMQNS